MAEEQEHSYMVYTTTSGCVDGVVRALVAIDDVTVMRIAYDSNIIDEITFKKVHLAITRVLREADLCFDNNKGLLRGMLEV